MNFQDYLLNDIIYQVFSVLLFIFPQGVAIKNTVLTKNSTHFHFFFSPTVFKMFYMYSHLNPLSHCCSSHLRAPAAPAGPSVPSGLWRASWPRRRVSSSTSVPRTWWTAWRRTVAAEEDTWPSPSTTWRKMEALILRKPTRTSDRYET